MRGRRLSTQSFSIGGPGDCGQDVEVRPAVRNVTSLHFSPAHAGHLTVTTAGGLLKLWELRGCGGAGQPLQALPRASSAHLRPLRCSAWRPDGRALFAGDARGAVLRWDLATGAVARVADAQAQVREVFYVAELGAILAVGADRSLRLVDPREDGAASSCGELRERPTAAALSFPTAAIAMRCRYVTLFDLRAGGNPGRTRQWGPSWGETTCLAAAPGGASVLCGSSTGNAATISLDGHGKMDATLFKPHRGRPLSWLGAHPTGRLFATAGEGRYKFWCASGDALCCVRRSRNCGGTLWGGSFSTTGETFAYAARVSDPAKMAPFGDRGDRVAIHAVTEDELACPEVEEDEGGGWGEAGGMEVVTVVRGMRKMDLYSPEDAGEGFDFSTALTRGMEGMEIGEAGRE